RANFYVQRKSYDLAMSNYDKAIQLNPKYYEAYVARGRLYHTLEDSQKAIADFTKAIQINPKRIEAYGAWAEICASEHMKTRAKNDYLKMISLTTDEKLIAQLRQKIEELK
ncbi:hypothetical protein HKBW3S09_01536, partial [Candidatus Hakubella thermalkaliphila]